MKKPMKREVKLGILLFAIFNIVNLIANTILPEMPILHFIQGGLVGLALSQIIIGILPEPTYLKLKNFKKKIL
ncbi:MAG: hypothetical protein HY818_17715 [Acetobacterium woodii]|nr:hypothetical protein [Acetobacterium woodii]